MLFPKTLHQADLGLKPRAIEVGPLPECGQEIPFFPKKPVAEFPDHRVIRRSLDRRLDVGDRGALRTDPALDLADGAGQPGCRVIPLDGPFQMPGGDADQTLSDNGAPFRRQYRADDRRGTMDRGGEKRRHKYPPRAHR